MMKPIMPDRRFHPRRRTSFAALRLVGLLTTLCSGCHSSAGLDQETARRLQMVAHVYFDYLAAAGQGPSNLEQLTAHWKQLEFLMPSQSDDDSAHWLSDRDGELFVIRFGLSASEVSRASQVPVAYEAIGRNGKRLVVFLSGAVECLSDGDCRERGVFP